MRVFQKYGPTLASVHSLGHNLWPLKAVTHLFKLAQRQFIPCYQDSAF